jgi:glycosyltransferase involved in cell wall biosynthesis
MPFLLNVGRFEHKKGQDVLVKAFQQIADTFPDLLLVMIGASVGGESAKVREIVRQSGLEHRIVVLENVPHERIAVFLKAARVFVLPSRREGLPFAILEAGVCEAPVVGTACVGVPEVIQDRVTGRLVPVEDAGALAAAISDLLLDEAECRQLARNLHRLIKEQFTWKRAYEDYVRL